MIWRDVSDPFQAFVSAGAGTGTGTGEGNRFERDARDREIYPTSTIGDEGAGGNGGTMNPRGRGGLDRGEFVRALAAFVATPFLASALSGGGVGTAEAVSENFLFEQ